MCEAGKASEFFGFPCIVQALLLSLLQSLDAEIPSFFVVGIWINPIDEAHREGRLVGQQERELKHLSNQDWWARSRLVCIYVFQTKAGSTETKQKYIAVVVGKLMI